MESFPEALEWLRRFRAKFDADDPIVDDEAALRLAKLATWPGPRRETMSLWGSVLELCIHPFPGDPPPELRAFVIEVASRVTDDEIADVGSAYRGSVLLILELLVLGGVIVGEPGVATRALRRWASVVNEEFLQAELGWRFLDTRPDTRALRSAAYLAYERADIGLAVETAEAGRLKLLAAVAADAPAGAPDHGGADLAIALSGAHAERLRALIDRPSRAAAEELVKADEGDGFDLAKLLHALATPWYRLASARVEDARATRLTADSVSDVVWTNALREPTAQWLVASLGDHQLLIYPFLTADHLGCVVWTRGEGQSIRADGPGSPPSAADAQILGAHLPDACAEAFSAGSGRREWTDVRVVDWDRDQTENAQAVALGYAMAPAHGQCRAKAAVATVIPSARILPPNRRGLASGRPKVTFIGDPTQDLPGPWLEASAWRSRYGEAVGLYLGAAATCTRTLEAFRTSSIVIISGHTFGTAGREHFGIRLCDGTLTHQDLLTHGEIAARQVILSCCSAAAAVGGGTADEVLGLVTTLLAIGARQVLAPLVPVRDAPCAVLGVTVADAVSNGADLSHALGHAIHAVWPTGRAQEVLAVPHVLPDAISADCPYDDSLLQARASVTRAEAFETLLHFSVFGGGLVSSDGPGHGACRPV